MTKFSGYKYIALCLYSLRSLHFKIETLTFFASFLVPEALLRLSRYRCREAKIFRVPTAQLCILPLFFP